MNAPRLPSAADLDALRLPAKSSFQAPYRAPTLDLAQDLDCSISASMALLGWKKTVREFVKTTIIGGASFLLPVAIIIFILSYAFRLIKRVAQPISESLHLDHLVGAGVGTVTVLSVVVLVLVSFVGGIAARTAAGRRVARWSESSFLGRFPHYQVIKSMAEGLAHIENASGLKPALVNIEDAWQIGYLLEQLENDWVAVFLPQAPSPMSGNVMYMPADRVRPLDITMVQAMSIVKAIGVGSSAALRGVDLTLPRADNQIETPVHAKPVKLP